MLSFAEAKAGLEGKVPPPQYRAVFERFDADGSGTLDLPEFVKLCRALDGAALSLIGTTSVVDRAYLEAPPPPSGYPAEMPTVSVRATAAERAEDAQKRPRSAAGVPVARYQPGPIEREAFYAEGRQDLIGELRERTRSAMEEVGKGNEVRRASVEALSVFTADDLPWLCSLRDPAPTVKAVIETVSIVLTGLKPRDYNEAKRTLLAPAGDKKRLFERLQACTPEAFARGPVDRNKLLRLALRRPELAPSAIATQSPAIAGLCRWLHALAAATPQPPPAFPRSKSKKTMKAGRIETAWDVICWEVKGWHPETRVALK